MSHQVAVRFLDIAFQATGSIKIECLSSNCISNMRAETRDRTGDLQIFGLTLSQPSYRGLQVHHQFQTAQRRRAETALVQILELSTAGSKMKVKRY